MFGGWPLSRLYTQQWITTRHALWSGQWGETRFVSIILITGKTCISGALGETLISPVLSLSWSFFSAAQKMTRSKQCWKRKAVCMGILSRGTSWTRITTFPTRPSWETSGSQSFVIRQSLLWRQMMTCSLISMRFDLICKCPNVIALVYNYTGLSSDKTIPNKLTLCQEQVSLVSCVERPPNIARQKQ